MSNPLGQIYNGLQLSINKRFSRGFSVLGSYTWSKNIDYNSVNNNMEDSTIMSPFNFNLSRGLADADHPHRFAGSFVWELPDAGKAVHSKPLSAVLGNWQMSGIVTLQSGRPFSVFSSGDRTAGAANGGNGDAFADLVGNLVVNGGSRGQQVANISIYCGGCPGCCRHVRHFGAQHPARTQLQEYRFERQPQFSAAFRRGRARGVSDGVFNPFNRPQLGQPHGTIGNRTFGRITSTASAPRIIATDSEGRILVTKEYFASWLL